MDRPSKILTLALAAVLASACGGPTEEKSTGGKSLNASTTPIAIIAAGNDCKNNGVATTDPGKPARIALSIQGAGPETHTLGYVADRDLLVNFEEAVLPQGAGNGTYKATLVLMEREECVRRGGGNACHQVGTRMPSDPGFGVRKTINFIVTNNQNSVLNTQGVGRGQDGIISDLVNEEGFLGKIAGAFAGGGGSGLGGLLGSSTSGSSGGLSSGFSKIIGAGEDARQAGAQSQFQPGDPVGGCTGQATLDASQSTPQNLETQE